jgi:hypothetical protein
LYSLCSGGLKDITTRGNNKGEYYLLGGYILSEIDDFDVVEG